MVSEYDAPSAPSPLCGVCALRAYWSRDNIKGAWRPVPAHGPDDAEVLVIGQAPDRQETEDGIPYIGFLSIDGVEDLANAGFPRETITYTNTVACRYPNDNPKKFEARVNAQKDPTAQSPLKCCHPRLLREIAAHKYIIPQGAMATKAVFPGSVKLKDVVGGPWPAPETAVSESLRGKKVLALHHPAEVFHKRSLKPLFKSWARKAKRWFRGELRWEDPLYTVNPPIEMLYQRLAEWRSGTPAQEGAPPPPGHLPEGQADLDDVSRAGGFKGIRSSRTVKSLTGESADLAKTLVIYDVETNGADPATADLRCCVFYDGRDVDASGAVVPFILAWRSVDDPPGSPVTVMSPAYEGAVLVWAQEAFADRAILWGGWNNRNYDRVNVQVQLGCIPYNEVCFLLWHRLAWPHYPHNLWFAASTLTDVYPWKAEKEATTAKTDVVLHRYNSRDGKTAYAAAHPSVRAAATRGHTPWHYALLEELQGVARGMGRLGMYVDEERRQAHEDTQRKRAADACALLHEYSPGLSPNAHSKIRKLLFQDFKLPPVAVTNTGLPSIDAETIRELYGSKIVPPEVLPLLRAIRDGRAAEKLLSTFIEKYRPGTFDGKRNQWICDPNGLVRFEYLVFGTAGWRWSSSGSAGNAQNIPVFLRDMFAAPEGYVYVYADMDQLELRFSAALAGALHFLEAFERNHIDTHNLSAEMVFGDAYWRLKGAPTDKRKKGSGAFARRRNLIKRVVYLAIYGGTADALKTVLSEVEELRVNAKTGEQELFFPYGRMDINAIEGILRDWHAASPEFGEWHKRELHSFRRLGYIEEPIWGMRRYLPDGEEPNKIYNTPVQSGGVALVHNGMLHLTRGSLPFNFTAQTGIVAQTHDSVVAQVKAEDAVEVQAAVEDALTQRYPHLPVLFTTEAKTRRHWTTPLCACGEKLTWVHSTYHYVCLECSPKEVSCTT